MWSKKQLLTYSALLFKEMGLSRAASLVMAWCLGQVRVSGWLGMSG